jgi:hypothetical protein
MRYYRIIILLLIFVQFPFTMYSQTCCSGGVPISGNLGLPPGNTGTWQFSLSYDFNVLKTLMEGSEVLDDQSRERITQSILFQTGYSISNRFSADIFFSYVKQERTINQFGRTDFTSTNGIGDAAILFKYNLTKSTSKRTFFTIAAGPKMPTGRSDFTREDGIPLNADLQPGSGSWDGLFWANGIYKFSCRPTFNVSSTLIFSIKGKNNNYLGDNTYQFGNEIQALVAVNDNFIVGNKILDTSINLRYRKALSDRFNETNMPSTGGQWLFLAPALAYNVSQKFAVNVLFEIPVYSEVEGTQLSPTYRVNVGAFFKINQKNNLLNIKG